MTLKNLLGIRLDAVQPDKAQIAKLLAAAEQNIADAQLLPSSVGLENAKVIVLDALRKQRNLADYSGDLVSEAAAVEALQSAKDLQGHLRAWLQANRPDLL
jgi:endonuclease/exonuclease/phosphatase (EEP) superfamily protein YafD